MADYFASLAARTLRLEPSVQPRQRVLWEEAAKPMAHGFPATEETTADDARPSPSDEAERPRRSRRKSIEESERPESEPVAKRPGRERGTRKSASAQKDTDAGTASTPHPTVRVLEPTVQARFERVSARRGDAPDRRPAVASERSVMTVRSSGIEGARPIPARRLTRERESAAEPVVRIHIGRVDVRAVTTAGPAASSPAARDNKRALMSLDEYVQNRDRGAS